MRHLPQIPVTCVSKSYPRDSREPASQERSISESRHTGHILLNGVYVRIGEVAAHGVQRGFRLSEKIQRDLRPYGPWIVVRPRAENAQRSQGEGSLSKLSDFKGDGNAIHDFLEKRVLDRQEQFNTPQSAMLTNPLSRSKSIARFDQDNPSRSILALNKEIRRWP